MMQPHKASTTPTNGGTLNASSGGGNNNGGNNASNNTSLVANNSNNPGITANSSGSSSTTIANNNNNNNNNSTERQTQQPPPMGRNASAGDTQPSLPGSHASAQQPTHPAATARMNFPAANGTESSKLQSSVPGSVAARAAPPGVDVGGSVPQRNFAALMGAMPFGGSVGSAGDSNITAGIAGTAVQHRQNAPPPRSYLELETPVFQEDRRTPTLAKPAEATGAGALSQPQTPPASQHQPPIPQQQTRPVASPVGAAVGAGTTRAPPPRLLQAAAIAAAPRPPPQPAANRPYAHAQAPPAQQQPPPAQPVQPQKPPTQQPQGGAKTGGGGGMRELRVEDALLYLDDVKKEFGDRPRVYNEFLAIMKNFKSQEVDTPGVIASVSKLFRGYNNLILGFNKFLPDGYKIGPEDIMKQDAAHAAKERQQMLNAQQPQKDATAQRPVVPLSGAGITMGGGAPPQTGQQVGAPPQPNQQQPPTQPSMQPPQLAATTQATLGTQQAQAPQQQQQQQQQPPPHNTQTGYPPQPQRGPAPSPPIPLPQQKKPVQARRVTMTAPRRRPGFNEQVDQRVAAPHEQQPALVQARAAPPAMPVHQHPPQPRPAVAPPQPPSQPQQQQPPLQQQALPPQQRHQPPPQQHHQQHHPPQPPSQQPQQPQQHQAVEFDHAISYVTTIKRRFANDPSTYHSFLEILHTYQKEQRGIKEVLEQVAHLFQDHPDLLKEFTFFLPDAVQEQAKERLHKAAADSEARQAAHRAQLEQQQQTQAQAQAHMQQLKEQQQHQQAQMQAHVQATQQQIQAQAQQHDHQQKVQDMDVEYSGASADSSANQQKFIDMTKNRIPPSEPEPAPSRKRPISNESAKEPPVVVSLPHQPETYVYNSAVERQFFDAAREALASYTRDGGQAWAEFLKCLDMYAQEILSRSEMLNFVEPLLGKRNTKLFEEFKRILAAAGAQQGSTPSLEDSWHSVPLSEIDFSRCRRCSPSYRALPRDYPAPPCSERSDEEAKVLNNVWVSLPVGSEESYTFRHMRRNTYEEILFRCEDERFEIDMVIDSNAATLHRLEPIAEEIAQLAQSELIIPENGTTPRPTQDGSGLGGKRFQYSFDKSILGVIHRNSIARIYGDAGREMLDLLVKNPAVAIPVVVQRLRQKDGEWRAVRDRLNRHWKELAEHNYYKSLDHRSLTWRTTDKRAISTRTLVAEIKDRAANRGDEGQAALHARMEKAKEEHGTFYEITMADAVSRKLDLTNLPKPDRRLFTPHLSLMYENNGWVQRDAYRILAFALERGATSPADKERCHRLWTDFLGPWFHLSLSWMQQPAIAFRGSSRSVAGTEMAPVVGHGDDSPAEEDEEESLDDDADLDRNVVTEDVRSHSRAHHDKEDGSSYMDHHPLPAGAFVSTIYGEGRIIEYRRSNDTYAVRLPFGTGYLNPNSVLCSILTVEKSAYTNQLREEDRTKLERPGDMLAIGTQSLYLFFRLHQILVRRLGIAKQLAYSIKDDVTLTTLVEQMPGDDAATLGRRRYDSFLSLVYALIDGGASMSVGGAAEGGKYEDRVRNLLGHRGYELATMDKLISHILKNLQSMGNDDTMWNLVQLYRRHLDAGSFKPDSFRQEAAYLSDGEAMYAFQQCPVHRSGGDQSVLYMEYLGVISESEDEEVVIPEPVIEEPVMKRPKRER